MGISFFKLCTIFFICLLPSSVFGTDNIPSYDIGIVTDGNSEEDLRILSVFQKELQTLADGEYTINFPDSATLSGNNSRQGVESAINKLYQNPDVDLVITLGYISSYLAYHGQNPPKPVIAPYIFDSLIREHLAPEIGRASCRERV